MSVTTSGPEWVNDETICPCGEKAGPEFRYGLCDKHAHETPAPALLRMGTSMGRLLKRVSELEHERDEIDQERRIVVAQRNRLIALARSTAVLMSTAVERFRAANPEHALIRDLELCISETRKLASGG